MVEPTEGYIQPGKSAACEVIFCSHAPSNNYNFDQICKVSVHYNVIWYGENGSLCQYQIWLLV